MDSLAGMMYIAKVRRYPSGEKEASIYPSMAKGLQTEGRTRRRLDVPEETRKQMNAQNDKRSMARTKANLRRRLMANEFDTLWTLTYAQTMLDHEQVKKDFQRFARGMRDTFGQFPYVVVYERQEERGNKEGNEGTWHIHFASKGRYHWQTVGRLWGHGFVQYQKAKGRDGWQPRKLARYLVKYISKAMKADPDKRRYSCSEGLTEPETVEIEFMSFGGLVSWLFADFGIDMFTYQTDGGALVWACNW